MNYIKDTTLQRIKKILDKNTKNFIYFELKKLNYELINKIEKISSKDDLLKITKKLFLHMNICLYIKI